MNWIRLQNRFFLWNKTYGVLSQNCLVRFRKRKCFALNELFHTHTHTHTVMITTYWALIQLMRRCTECLVYWLYSYIFKMIICFVSKDSQMNCTVSKGRHGNRTSHLDYRATLTTDVRLSTIQIQFSHLSMYDFKIRKKEKTSKALQFPKKAFHISMMDCRSIPLAVSSRWELLCFAGTWSHCRVDFLIDNDIHLWRNSNYHIITYLCLSFFLKFSFLLSNIQFEHNLFHNNRLS